ncbi:unnamed protein product [Rotaria sp. Silwood1]|nr:unnamed protein product [Rotaria sp. Silwood1]
MLLIVSVWRYEWLNGSRSIQGEGESLDDLDSCDRWTCSLLSPTDQKMFTGHSSLTGHDDDDDPLSKASFQIVNLDGTNQSTFTFGPRNPTSLSIHPISEEFYIACQERDGIGDDLVSNFFT